MSEHPNPAPNITLTASQHAELDEEARTVVTKIRAEANPMPDQTANAEPAAPSDDTCADEQERPAAQAALHCGNCGGTTFEIVPVVEGEHEERCLTCGEAERTWMPPTSPAALDIREAAKDLYAEGVQVGLDLGRKLAAPAPSDYTLRALTDKWREEARRVRPLESARLTTDKRERVLRWMLYTNCANELDAALRADAQERPAAPAAPAVLFTCQRCGRTGNPPRCDHFMQAWSMEQIAEAHKSLAALDEFVDRGGDSVEPVDVQPEREFYSAVLSDDTLRALAQPYLDSLVRFSPSSSVDVLIAFARAVLARREHE